MSIEIRFKINRGQSDRLDQKLSEFSVWRKQIIGPQRDPLVH